MSLSPCFAVYLVLNVVWQEYNKRTSEYLSKDDDELPQMSPIAKRSHGFSASVDESAPKPEGRGEGDGGKKGKGKKWKLEEVERWTMVKRIW